MAWVSFAAAWLIMLLSHAVPAQPVVRARLIGLIGKPAYLLLYSLMSLLVMWWLVAASLAAPRLMLWWPAPWTAWVPLLVMLPACALITFALAAPNPLSFGGARPQAFDPDRPGVVGVARHPLLWALALWSGAHVMANGALALVLLFGSVAVFSITGMAVLDRRLRRQWGAAEWQRLAARSSAFPLAAWLDGRWRPVVRPSALRGAMALALWLGLIALHERVIGMPALPPALWW